MKSTLKRFIPMEKIEIPAEMLTTAPTAAEREQEDKTLQEAIESLLRGHIELVPVDQAEEGSVVTLSLQSRLPRYHRESVNVTLGLGLYSAELEAAIPGKPVGGTFETTVEGETVTGRVLSARNRVVPKNPRSIELDREADGAADYDAWVELQNRKAYDQRVQDRVKSLLQHITLKMNELCEPQFDEEEFEARNQVSLDGIIKQYCEIFGVSENEIDPDIINMQTEQVRGSTQWEMGDALFGIAMGLEPYGEGDEIRQYAMAFRIALQDYCKSILKEEQ